MDVKLFKKWIEALESGNYSQGASALKREVGRGKYEHCCLGVLCEVAGVDWSHTADHEGRVSVERGSHSFLPPHLADRAVGKVVIDPTVVATPEIAEIRAGFEAGQEYGLTEINDAGVPFSMIANALRSTYWGDKE